MILSLGWKNVWRGKTRSLVVIVAVMLGIFGGIMASGIMTGWIEQRIHDSIHNEISHAQIHNIKYMENEEIQHTIKNYGDIASILDTLNGVEAWCPRTKLFVMAKTSWAASGFILRGVDMEREKEVFELQDHIVEGEFLEKEYRKPSIVIGAKTAENLKLLNYQVTPEKLDSFDSELLPESLIPKLEEIGNRRFRKERDFREKLAEVLSKDENTTYGDDLIEYFSFYRLGASVEVTLQDKYGDIIHPVFKVRGIYDTDNSMWDGMNAYVDRKTLNQYTLLADNEIHEIAILASDNETGAAVADKLSELLPEQNVMSWKRISPELAMYTEFSNLMAYIYVVIILFALAFGIVNTMMMSVLERVKELGMLMAIGMNKKRVFTMIMAESVFLTLTGAVLGMLASGIIVEILSHTGINFGMWSEGFEAIGYATIVYPVVTIENYLVITVMVIFTGIVASIWPARKALRLNPVEALRME
jgi:ABC-type lipoprotein release transport system permease subunit